MQRFVRLAARYEEEYLGSTKIGYPTASFDTYTQQLGSGLIFPDDVSASRELTVNAYRIEGWRRTNMYEHYMAVRLYPSFDILGVMTLTVFGTGFPELASN